MFFHSSMLFLIPHTGIDNHGCIHHLHANMYTYIICIHTYFNYKQELHTNIFIYVYIICVKTCMHTSMQHMHTNIICICTRTSTIMITLCSRLIWTEVIMNIQHEPPQYSFGVWGTCIKAWNWQVRRLQRRFSYFEHYHTKISINM